MSDSTPKDCNNLHQLVDTDQAQAEGPLNFDVLQTDKDMRVEA